MTDLPPHDDPSVAPEPQDGSPVTAADATAAVLTPETGETAETAERKAERRAERAAERAARRSEDRLAARLAHQWSTMRREAQRMPDPAPRPDPDPAEPLAAGVVPPGVDLAAAWAWRFLVIAVAGYVIVRAAGVLQEVTVPLAVATFTAALVSPVVTGLTRLGLPRGLSALLTVVGTLAVVGALLTLAGQQVANGADGLATSTAQGLGEIRDWLKTGPLHASDSQINDYIQKAQDAITQQVSQGGLANRLTEVTSAVSHIAAGFFIVLFATYFFLADGARIWSWIVRLAPGRARARVDSSGRVAWISLKQFVRATVIVAATDSVGVMIGAAVLQVPFVLAIGVLVFLGAFVPLVGAFVAGGVAVLVALVAKGPVVALIMLGVIVAVQQLESHVLQPFLMGRWVSVHPLGVIIAIATGIVLAGIVGALVAVPLAAMINAVVVHLSGHTRTAEDAKVALGEDYERLHSAEPVKGLGDA